MHGHNNSWACAINLSCVMSQCLSQTMPCHAIHIATVHPTSTYWRCGFLNWFFCHISILLIGGWMGEWEISQVQGYCTGVFLLPVGCVFGTGKKILVSEGSIDSWIQVFSSIFQFLVGCSIVLPPFLVGKKMFDVFDPPPTHLTVQGERAGPHTRHELKDCPTIHFHHITKHHVPTSCHWFASCLLAFFTHNPFCLLYVPLPAGRSRFFVLDWQVPFHTVDKRTDCFSRFSKTKFTASWQQHSEILTQHQLTESPILPTGTQFQNPSLADWFSSFVITSQRQR